MVLFLSHQHCHLVPDSHKHRTPHNCNEVISQETVSLHPTMDVPVVCTETIPETTDGTNTFFTESLNATTGTSNTTDSPDSISPGKPLNHLKRWCQCGYDTLTSNAKNAFLLLKRFFCFP